MLISIESASPGISIDSERGHAQIERVCTNYSDLAERFEAPNALMGRRSDLSKLVNNQIRTNRFRFATSGRQGRDPGFRSEVVHAAIRTQGDQLLQLDRQAPRHARP